GVFFFSSRRRHTRSKRDWSSDVCSSDLRPPPPKPCRGRPVPPGCKPCQKAGNRPGHRHRAAHRRNGTRAFRRPCRAQRQILWLRSEERRVGEEGRCRGGRTRGEQKRTEN